MNYTCVSIFATSFIRLAPSLIPRSHNICSLIFVVENTPFRSPKIVRGCSEILVNFRTLPKLSSVLCRLRVRKGPKIVVGRMFRDNCSISERCRESPSLFADCEIGVFEYNCLIRRTNYVSISAKVLISELHF